MASQVVGLQCMLIIIISTSCFLGYCMARKEYSYQPMTQRYKSHLVQELINQINAQDLVTVGRTYASNKRTTDDLLDDSTRLFQNRKEIPDYDSNKLMLDDNSMNHLRRRNIDEDRSDLTPVSNYHQRPVVADSRSSPWTLERPSKYCSERYYVPGPSSYSFICRDLQMVGATNKQLMATLPGEPTKAESRRLLLDLKNYFNRLKETRSMMNIRKLSLEEEDELSKRIDLLLKDGKQIEGTSPTIDIHSRPDYLDDTRFDAAQKVINRYYVSVSMASSMGLMLLIQLEEILIPLLRTGKSRTVPDLYDRYSATIKYIRKCYESRFYDSTSEAWKYINIVRSMHQRIFKLMNAQTDSRHDSDSSKYLWVNQYDMAVTQFAFVGMFILRPDKCGAPNLTEQELSDITYFWRVLSYYFGIENRFNLFIYHDDVAKQIRLIEIIFEQYKQKLNEPRNSVGVGMAEGIMLAFEELSTDATFNILDHHWHDTISLSGRPQLLPYTGLAELWKLARLKAVLKLTANSDMVRNMINQIYKKRTDKFCNNGERIKKRLIKKYPKHIFESNDANMISGSVRE